MSAPRETLSKPRNICGKQKTIQKTDNKSMKSCRKWKKLPKAEKHKFSSVTCPSHATLRKKRAPIEYL